LRRFVDETDSLRFLKRFVEHRSELLDLAEDVHELQGFYTNQRQNWETLRSTVDTLGQNRLQLEANEVAGPALKRMEEILAAPRPYAMLKEAADLTHRAREVNEALVVAARAPALEAIGALLSSVETEASKAAAPEGVQERVTAELNRLLDTAATATSIAHIAQAAQAADGAFDRALALIEEAVKKRTQEAPGTDTQPHPVTPPLKKRRTVEARSAWPRGFIETQDDIEAFLQNLRNALETAVAADERVQIK
jgi:hypothetical protein